MKRKNIIILTSLVACYFASKLSPWFTNITYYIKHMSVFMLVSFVSYLTLKRVYDFINDTAKTEKQIRLNGIFRVVVQGLLLVVIVFAQLRYIERKDTVTRNHCEYFDRYGTLIFESQYYFECPEYSIIENTDTTLKMEFVQKTDDYYFRTYFYNPEYSIDKQSDNILGFMDFELLTTINITYNDAGYILDSETIHSLVANNHSTKTSVLTTKTILLKNTYIDGLYTSLKTTTTAYDDDYEYNAKPQHLEQSGIPKYYEYTYSTLISVDDSDQIDIYTVESDEFGNPLDGNIPELLLSSKVYKQEDSINILIESTEYFDIDVFMKENYVSYSYKVDDMDAVFDWEDVGNVPLLKKDRTYDNIGFIDYKVVNRKSVTQIHDNGNQVSFFRDYSDVYNQYPSLINVTDFGYIREDYYASNNNYFIIEEDNIDEAWESIFLMNFNLYRIDEIYEPDSFFDVNDSTTLYQKLPYFYTYYLD